MSTYTHIENFKNGYAKVRNVLYGYIREKDYKEIIPTEYTSLSDFKFGMVTAEKKFNQEGVIDSSGNVIIPFQYKSVTIIDQDRIKISKELWEKEALVNRKGEFIVPFGRFNRIDELSENRMAVRDGHKWGYIDRDGKVVIPLKYNRAETFSEGLATVRIGKNHGCVDVDGNLVIPMMYDEIGQSKHGLMAAQKGDKWGFINHANETVVPFTYRRVSSFDAWKQKTGTAEVLDDNGYGIIDKTGNQIIPCLYKYLMWENDVYIACKHKKYGVLDEQGNIIHDFIYDRIQTYKNGEIIGISGKTKVKLEKTKK